MSRTDATAEWLPKIAEAALANDSQRLELILISAIRSLKADSPEISKKLGGLLAQSAANPAGLRGAIPSPPPLDGEEGLALVRTISTEGAPAPIIRPVIDNRIQQFIRERRDCSRLLSEGFLPPSSILLVGAPGTGKTMLARWLAGQLDLPLVVQDLATSISSLLGKTGFNLRRTLDYARSCPCVLLLDEFDAIAKKRDDSLELGELKRIVNVLLKELENWPIQSILVAATNHPELLDPAIGRRFNLTIELPLPDEDERVAILSRAAGRFIEKIPKSFVSACGKTLQGKSGSDLDSLMQAAVRRHLSNNIPLVQCLAAELVSQNITVASKRGIGKVIREFQEASAESFTVRDLAAIFGKSISTIQHHLSTEVKNG